MSACVAAVDVGTSAVRAALVSVDGEVLASTRIARGSDVAGETFDAEALLAHVVDALAQATAATKAVPVALALSAHIGAVAVDARFRPVDAGGGWADSRGLEALTALDPADAASLLGAAGRPALSGGALAYLLGADPAIRSRIASVLSPKDFLVARLTGVASTDTVDAAYTLASDVRRRDWNADALSRLGVPLEMLPPQIEPMARAGELTAAAADATGLPTGLPVISGGPDGSVGIGLLLGENEHLIADVAGTTDVVGRLLPRGTEHPRGSLLNPALVPGRFVAGGATGLTGGAVARWRGLVGAVDDDALAAVAPGSDGLSILPTMSGTRFPRWRSDSRGAVLGQRPEHGPAHLLRAAQEAATYTVREGIDLLDPSRRLPVVFAGGSARSLHVARLRADALGRLLLVSPEPDVTLLGAAALALVGAGLASGLDAVQSRLVGEVCEIEPAPAASTRYDELYLEWQELRDRVDGEH